MKMTKIVIIAACAIAAFSCAPKAQEVSEPSALDVIMSRKSVRTYTEQALTDAQIETLLRAAMAAPTGMNVQPWRFVVVRDQAVKDALAGPRGGMVAQAPCVQKHLIHTVTPLTKDKGGFYARPESCSLFTQGCTL